jgi:tetratricopeptide (TPR) repeat protein
LSSEGDAPFRAARHSEFLDCGFAEEPGETSRLGRTDLAAEPLRRAGFANCRLEDWCVPVVLEQGPVRLCAPAPGVDQARQKPARPVRGTPFVGRDETLFRLDRAFDSSHAVLLSGEIGSGKSACAEAFGRWYRTTGGCTELRRVSARDESPDATLTKLEADIDAHTPPPGLLWTIDDVDYVDGFPVRPVSRWKGRHRNRLRNWLLRARAAEIKVLLVGRRMRQDWAGSSPTTVVMRSLNEQDRAELLLQHQPVAEAPLEWRPLTTASDGNPQMLLSLLAAVVPDVAAGVQDIGPLVEAIVAGEHPFAPNDTLLPTLRVALSGDVAGKHRTVLSALHLLRAVVSAADLHVLGMPGLDWQLVELAAAGRDETVAKTVLQALADRGLLLPFAKDWYRMHPALPAVLRDSFICDYPDDRARLAERSYVYGCADFANHGANFIIQGRLWLFGLREHLPNLQRAWRIAIARGWLDQAVHLMQGLEEVLRADHRLAAFKRLVDEIEPLISTPTGPHPQWRAEWRIVQEYKARLAATDRTFYSEEETAAALAALTPSPPDAAGELARQNYAAGLSEQGLHLLQRGDPAGLTLIERSLDIARVLNDTSGQITCLIQLGTGYAQIEPNDIEKAVALLEEAVTKASSDEYGRLRLIALHTLTKVLIARMKELSMQRVSGRALTPLMERIFGNLRGAEPLVLNAHSPELRSQQARLLGEALLLDWKYEDAIDAFNTAIQLSARDPIRIATCRMMIALCLKLLGRTEAALEYERSARALAEQHGFALNVARVTAGRC